MNTLNPFDANAMHPTQLAYFRFRQNLKDITATGLASFYADLIATAHRDFNLTAKAKAKTGINMYNALLQDLGFDRKSRTDLVRHIAQTLGSQSTPAKLAIVVVGCQNEALLSARAAAAAKLFQACVEAVQSKVENIHIVFSGKHPPENEVAITNEAMELKNLFEASLMSTNAYKHYEELEVNGRVHQEADSEDTGGNVKKVFSVLAKTGSEEGISNVDPEFHLFLISNDFHLVRLDLLPISVPAVIRI